MRTAFILSGVIAVTVSASLGTAAAAPGVLKDLSGLRERMTKQSFVIPAGDYDGYGRCYRKCWTDDYGVRHCRRRCY